MTFEKREELIRLYDIYLNLLTNKQQQYFEEYYFDDLSISEIASNHEISRNAVFDQIKRVILNLEEYETKLKLVDKIAKIEGLSIDSELKNKIIDILKE